MLQQRAASSAGKAKPKRSRIILPEHQEPVPMTPEEAAARDKGNYAIGGTLLVAAGGLYYVFFKKMQDQSSRAQSVAKSLPEEESQ